MKCFRTVQTQFGTPNDLFTGVGASTTAARWNDVGSYTIYSSTAMETSVSERAFHSLLRDIELYNQAVGDKGKIPPAHYYEMIQKVAFSIGEIDLVNTDGLIDLTSEYRLKEVLKEAGLPDKTLQDARRSKYRLYPPLWTRILSKYLFEQGYLGFMAPSARSNAGHTVVVFEENLQQEDFRILQIQNIEISALSLAGKTLKKGEIATTDKVYFQSALGEGEAPILIL